MSTTENKQLVQESLDWLNETVKNFRQSQYILHLIQLLIIKSFEFSPHIMQFMPFIFNLLEGCRNDETKRLLEKTIKELNNDIQRNPVKVAKDLGYAIESEDEDYCQVDFSETSVFKSEIFNQLRAVQLFEESLIKVLREKHTLRIGVYQEMKHQRFV